MSKRNFSMFAVAIAVPAIVTGPMFACGSSGGKSPDAHVTLHDSPAAADAPPACTAMATYPAGTFGSAAGSAKVDNFPAGEFGSNSPHENFFGGALTAAAMPDVVFLDFFAGTGGFTGGDIKTGTFTISGADAAFSTCGICVDVATGFNTSTGADTGWYHAIGGTVTLTNVGPTAWTGSASNVMLKHVTETSMGPTDTAAPDGCTTTLTNVTVVGRLAQCMGSGSATMCGSAIGKPDESDVIASLRHRHY